MIQNKSMSVHVVALVLYKQVRYARWSVSGWDTTGSVANAAQFTSKEAAKECIKSMGIEGDDCVQIVPQVIHFPNLFTI